MTVDTACSSSLVAIHLAASALRAGECSLALAGGVTVLSNPGVFIEFSRQRGIAPDGRCKSFAAAADGVGWAEGAGIVLLERLSEAQRNGHPVLATLRGSATNQDGASNGLTAPNGPSQERVIRQALANAGLTPAEVDAVEAHGTGTSLGDPIEAGALLATYGKERQGDPLWLGSVKSNLGHTQAAAGVAGVIKMVLAMRHGALPASLHLDSPSPHVQWSDGEIELLAEARPWEPGEHPRRAAVSSFGISGTNAHLILEEAPEQDKDEQPEEKPPPPIEGVCALPLSARSEAALRSAGARLGSHLRSHPELELADVAHTLASRAALERRAVVVGTGREELLGALASLGAAEPDAAVLEGEAVEGKLAYLLSGQGSQRPGMGRELAAASPAFAAALDETCAELDPHLDRPLAPLVFGEDEDAAELLARTEHTQPALFALEVSLFRLLGSLGLEPDFLIGHSIGELSAAHLAGVLSLPDAARLVCARGALMGALPQGGAMLAIEASEAEAAEGIAALEGLAIAAVNAPGAVVVSGPAEQIEALAERFSERRTSRLRVSHAFHSPLMEPMLADFEAVAKELDYQPPQIPIVSNLSGELLSDEQATDPAYWVRQVREPVRFAAGVDYLAAAGVSTFLELGPGAALGAMVEACLPEGGQRPRALALLAKDRPEPESALGALGAAWANGAQLDWDALHPGAEPVPLPTYPFQRERYWLASDRGGGDAPSLGQAAVDHPLLGASVELPGEGLLLTGRISTQTHPWLADHAVAGAVLLPATAFAELAIYAGERLGCPELAELTLQAPLVLSEQDPVAIGVRLGEPSAAGERALSIYSRPAGERSEDGEGEWLTHAEGLLAPQSKAPPPPEQGPWPPPGAEPLQSELLYDRLAEIGLDYGPLFQGVSAAYRDGEAIYAEVALPATETDPASAFGLHPALFDAALHASLLSEQGASLRLPFAWGGVRLHAHGAAELRVRIAPTAEDEIALSATDPAGEPVLEVGSLKSRPLDPAQLAAARPHADSLFALRWSPAPTAEPAAGPLAVLGAPLESLGAATPYESLDALAEAVEAGEPAPEAVLVPAPQSKEALPAAAHRASAETLALLQRWLSLEPLADSRLILITSEALAARQGESPDLAQAPLVGLMRSAHSEHPGRFSLIDSDASEASTAALAQAIALSGEPQVALREGEALCARLARVRAAEPDREQAPLDPERTVLITGATGGLGALVARHLAEAHGARHLLLLSRSGEEAQGAGELKAELQQAGAEAQILACDVADREALAEAIAQIPAEHPLGAIVHAAGVLDDGVLDSLDRERLDTVFAPKADAAHHLHELSRDAELSQFVLFSSAAGTFGNPGQANYAAANAFCDALAARRQAQGLPATSLAWGLWEQASSMTGELADKDRARLARQGVAPLSAERGLELFDAARAQPTPLLFPLPLKLGALRAQAREGALPTLLAELVRVPTSRTPSGSLAKRLAAVPESERQALVLELVKGHVAAVLGHPSGDAIDPQRAFKEIGFDSLGAVELRNRLSQASGLRLPSTLVFDHPTPAAVAELLLELVDVADGGADVEEEFAKVNAALAALAGGRDRARVKDRLQALERRLKDLIESAEDGDGRDGQLGSSLDSVSDDEIFELIDEKFGDL